MFDRTILTASRPDADMIRLELVKAGIQTRELSWLSVPFQFRDSTKVYILVTLSGLFSEKVNLPFQKIMDSLSEPIQIYIGPIPEGSQEPTSTEGISMGTTESYTKPIYFDPFVDLRGPRTTGRGKFPFLLRTPGERIIIDPAKQSEKPKDDGGQDEE